MKFFILAFFISWLCGKLDPIRRIKAKDPWLYDDPPRKSRRWTNKALKHGLKMYIEKDPEYIAKHKKRSN